MWVKTNALKLLNSFRSSADMLHTQANLAFFLQFL